MSREYDCTECGLCCTLFGGELHIYEEDFARWQEEADANILGRLKVIDATTVAWYAPDGGAREAGCPFLTTGGSHRCTIYPTRPLVCRHFANGGSACRELRQRHNLPVEDLMFV